jgi:single-stranded DNA-binding protein
MVNRFELLGSVTHSPEFLRTAAGTPFCFLRMETKRFVSGQPRTDYHFITIWSASAQRVAELLNVGDPVFIEGRIEAGIATRNDSMRASTIRLVASRVQAINPRVPEHRDPNDHEPIGTFIDAPASEELS